MVILAPQICTILVYQIKVNVQRLIVAGLQLELDRNNALVIVVRRL